MPHRRSVSADYIRNLDRLSPFLPESKIAPDRTPAAIGRLARFFTGTDFSTQTPKNRRRRKILIFSTKFFRISPHTAQRLLWRKSYASKSFRSPTPGADGIVMRVQRRVLPYTAESTIGLSRCDVNGSLESICNDEPASTGGQRSGPVAPLGNKGSAILLSPMRRFLSLDDTDLPQ